MVLMSIMQKAVTTFYNEYSNETRPNEFTKLHRITFDTIIIVLLQRNQRCEGSLASIAIPKHHRAIENFTEIFGRFDAKWPRV